MNFTPKLHKSTRSTAGKPDRPPEMHKHISIRAAHEESSETDDPLPTKEETRRPKSRAPTSRGRRRSSSTETIAIILSERLRFETNRVSQLATEIDDQRRAYTLLLAKYTALQNTCNRLELEVEEYRAKFEAQRAEIYKAQDIVADVDRRRRNAEEEAVRGRQALRELKTDIAVRGAREGGWRVGFQQGAREAGYLLGGFWSKPRRRDGPLDEEREEKAARKRSTSRSSARASSSAGSGPVDQPSPPGGYREPRPDTPTASQKGFRSTLRRSLSRSRSRPNSVSEVSSPTSSQGADVPVVPALPARPPSRPRAQTPSEDQSRHRWKAVVNDAEEDSQQVEGASVSEESTRISEYDLVSPPRDRRVPEGYAPFNGQYAHADRSTQSTGSSAPSDRPRTSQGYRPSTPHVRELYKLGAPEKAPLYRHHSGGTVNIEVQPPSRSPTTPSSKSRHDPVLLSAATSSFDPQAPPQQQEDDFLDPLSTAGLLDAISRDSDTSYFPHVASTLPERPSSARPASRSTTPKTHRRPSYDAAPLPLGVSYPQPPPHPTSNFNTNARFSTITGLIIIQFPSLFF